MQSPREDMRKTLEKAVIIESAKTDSGFKYTYASKEAYKIVFIKNDLFHCIRGLTDPHNSCNVIKLRISIVISSTDIHYVCW